MNVGFVIRWFVSLVLVSPEVWGSTLVLDSFSSGDFVLDQNSPGFTSAITGPIGSQRHSLVSSRVFSPGTTSQATLNSSIGILSFEVDGTSLDSRPLELALTYAPGGPFSLLGYDALVFDFASVSGSGFIIVELGSPSDTYGPEVPRVPIDSAGSITFPFSELTFGTGGSVDSFNALQITFEAETEQFSFTLNEVRAVPEPSAVYLAGIGVLCLLRRRRVLQPLSSCASLVS